ncbi:MAG: hypothetical protein IJY39_01710 [Clostridia bacterium]|nr:hypothetical protein [Clostridia bacterium]
MKIAVISRSESDLEQILSEYGEITRISPDDKIDLSGFDACAILGGVDDELLLLPIHLRLELERFRGTGKPVFSEWCASVGYAYADEGCAVSTVSHRMVYVGEDKGELHQGDLLDDRANTFVPFPGLTVTCKPILCFCGHVIAHDRIESLPRYSASAYALWELDNNTLMCAFRLCNYVRARFAPQSRWDAIVSLIVSHLVGREACVHTKAKVSMDHSAVTPRETFSRGLEWFDGANILIENGESGVIEGLSHRIRPDGKQIYSRTVRNDCSGEVGGAYFFDAYLNGSEDSLVRFENLQKFCFEKLYEREGAHRGLMRWSTTAWEVCYQDDVARTVLGSLLSMQLTDSKKYLPEICAALDYLLSTTGTDGLRVSRTDAQFLSPERIDTLKNSPSSFPCAHHNGYYMAVLLLAYGLTGEKRYFDTALKGIETLMNAFPNTIREHSETQELCRLVLPLSCLYEITKEEKHCEYLYRVLDRLEQYRDSRGGYLEHDTGYQAKRSRTSGTESSLLAENGDPVQDLLYSVNWLPLGFAYGYKATGDRRFLALWRGLVTFFSEIQTVSEDKWLNGSWCRAIDSSRREAYGMPHDVGWGPCAVESGWTVGEILMGIGFGLALGMESEID